LESARRRPFVSVARLDIPARISRTDSDPSGLVGDVVISFFGSKE
jgi:hypothetical protein